MHDHRPTPLPEGLFRLPHHQYLYQWTDKEAEDYLTTGWGSSAITELKLEYLYGPEPEVSGD
tara:strand:- start:121 stop:306 length:186 start_codon:yes stop_codon:yes gene_type:complete